MLTPNHVVTTSRAVLIAGALTAAVLMLGPWPGLEQVFGLSDKAAHAIAFGGLVAVSFVAFPRMRRNDLALAAVVLGASVEVAQLFTADRSASLADLGADALGVGVVYLSSQIEGLRKLARDKGAMRFRDIKANDRRARRRPASAPTLVSAPVAFTPKAGPFESERQTSFAGRAAQHFPPRRTA
jgi:VanZ family protein